MATNTKSILVINYSFPTHPGIGGRRWAKFSKYLAAQGYSIYVIAAEDPSMEKSLWCDDVVHDNIKVFKLPAKYPEVFIEGARNLVGKFKFRFWKMIFTIYSRGTVFERTLFWKRQLVKEAVSIIDQKEIKNVIVTIPPYRLAYYSTFLKKLRPGINLIVDFRDPWADNKTFHGFNNISPKRLKFEEKMEIEVLNMADKVVSVTTHTTNYLKGIYKGSGNKFLTIPNGYDPDDLNIQANYQKTDRIIFVHTGSVYSNLDYILKPFLGFLLELKKSNLDLYKKLSFEFYGANSSDFNEVITTKELDCFSINPGISLADSIKKISSATCCLLLAAPDHGFNFSTKFYEYIGCRKPIVLLSNKGDASDFIETNGIGKCIGPENFNEDMINVLYSIQNGRFEFSSSFNVEQFSIKNLTEKYKEILI